MKTINDLLEYLSFSENDKYSLTELEDELLISRKDIIGSTSLMVVRKSNSEIPFEWNVSEDFQFEKFSVREKIMRFVINSNPIDWFDDEIIEVDGIKLTRGQAEKVYHKLTSERLYNNK